MQNKIYVFIAIIMIVISIFFISFGIYLEIENKNFDLVKYNNEKIFVNVDNNNSLTDNNNLTDNNIIYNESKDVFNYETFDLTQKNVLISNEIKDKYNININYGSTLNNYSVLNYSVNALLDEQKINDALVNLRKNLLLYPSDMEPEFRKNDFSLTVNIVDSFTDDNVTGLTYSVDKNVTIIVAVKYPFDVVFNHEFYHYMELLIESKGGDYGAWNTLNPFGFTYGSVNPELSYTNNFNYDAPFVNDYAQYSDKEDRASTFEYMMSDFKAICMNKDSIVWKKSRYIASTIDYYFDSVNANTIEYWERYL